MVALRPNISLERSAGVSRPAQCWEGPPVTHCSGWRSVVTKSRLSWIAVLAFAALALWMHVSHCSWWLLEERRGSDDPLVIGLGGEQFGWTIIATEFHVWYGRGVFAQAGIGKADAAVFGLAVPFALFALSVVLVQRLRRAAWALQGRCPTCNHLLDPAVRDPSRRCPECGWRPVQRAIETSHAPTISQRDDPRPF